MDISVNRRWLGVLAGVTTALVLLPGIAACDPAMTPAGRDANKGRAAYVEHGCYQCHGYDGQGGFAGVRIAPEPLPYPAFEALVRYPANLMPAYSPSMLSDADLKLIHDYVAAVSKPGSAADVRALIHD